MPPQGPPAFVSYSRDDADFALQLVLDLKRAGVNVWMDKLDIRAGRLWDSAIEDAVNGCARILVILSPSSVNSPNVMAEVSFAMDEQKEIIPVLYRACRIPFRLRRIEYIDLSNDQEYPRRLEELAQIMATDQPLAHLAPSFLDTPPILPDPPAIVPKPIAPLAPLPIVPIPIPMENLPPEKRFKLPALEHAPQIQDPAPLIAPAPIYYQPIARAPAAASKPSGFFKSAGGRITVAVCAVVVLAIAAGIYVAASKPTSSDTTATTQSDPSDTTSTASTAPAVDTRLVGKWTGRLDNQPAVIEFDQTPTGIEGTLVYDASHDPSSPDHVSETISVTQNQDQVTLTGTAYRDLDGLTRDFKLDTFEVKISTDGTRFAGNISDPWGTLEPILFTKSQ